MSSGSSLKKNSSSSHSDTGDGSNNISLSCPKIVEHIKWISSIIIWSGNKTFFNKHVFKDFNTSMHKCYDTGTATQIIYCLARIPSLVCTLISNLKKATHPVTPKQITPPPSRPDYPVVHWKRHIHVYVINGLSSLQFAANSKIEKKKQLST